MKKYKFLAPLGALSIYTLSLTLTPRIAHAGGSEIRIRPLSGFTNVSQIVNTLIAVAMFGGGLLCLGYLILGAFKYVTAQDNSANTAAARQTMINAIIGLVLLSLVYVIFQIAIRIVPGLDKWFGFAT